jgi:hypothetical protein
MAPGVAKLIPLGSELDRPLVIVRKPVSAIYREMQPLSLHDLFPHGLKKLILRVAARGTTASVFFWKYEVALTR